MTRAEAAVAVAEADAEYAREEAIASTSEGEARWHARGAWTEARDRLIAARAEYAIACEREALAKSVADLELAELQAARRWNAAYHMNDLRQKDLFAKWRAAECALESAINSLVAWDAAHPQVKP